jgi:hypothetical protein
MRSGPDMVLNCANDTNERPPFQRYLLTDYTLSIQFCAPKCAKVQIVRQSTTLHSAHRAAQTQERRPVDPAGHQRLQTRPSRRRWRARRPNHQLACPGHSRKVGHQTSPAPSPLTPFLLTGGTYHWNDANCIDDVLPHAASHPCLTLSCCWSTTGNMKSLTFLAVSGAFLLSGVAVVHHRQSAAASDEGRYSFMSAGNGILWRVDHKTGEAAWTGAWPTPHWISTAASNPPIVMPTRTPDIFDQVTATNSFP